MKHKWMEYLVPDLYPSYFKDANIQSLDSMRHFQAETIWLKNYHPAEDISFRKIKLKACIGVL